MPKTIPTSAQWKLERENTFKLTKEFSDWLVTALNRYHKEKKKGAFYAHKAIVNLKLAVKAYPDIPELRLYFVEKKLEEEQKSLELYFAEFIRKIDARLKKLIMYQRIVKDAQSLTLEEVFDSAKLLEAVRKFADREFQQENYFYLVAYRKLRYNPNQAIVTQVKEAMIFIDGFKLTTVNFVNITSAQANRVKNIRAQEDAILDEVRNKKPSVLWKELCGALAECYDNIFQLMNRDAFNRFKRSPELAEVQAKIKGIDLKKDL